MRPGPRRSGPTGQPLEGTKILVADGSSTGRRILRELLESRGASVTDCAGSLKAVAELRKARRSGEPYHYLFLDSGLADADGFHMAERIQSDPGLRDGLNLIMTLNADNLDLDLTRLESLKISRYLTKPVKQADVLEILESDGGEPPETEAPERMDGGKRGSRGPRCGSSWRKIRNTTGC